MPLEVVVEDVSGLPGVPAAERFQAWLDAAFDSDEPASLALRIVSIDEMQSLNHRFRGKDEPTNVLSFTADIPDVVAPDLESRPLGDIAICAALVEREAKAQDKSIEAHWAHLAIHGLLHLLGYDHEQEAEAEAMEAMEVRVLASLGISNPYE